MLIEAELSSSLSDFVNQAIEITTCSPQILVEIDHDLAQVSYYLRGTPIKPGPASQRHYKVALPFRSDLTAGQARFQSIPRIW